MMTFLLYTVVFWMAVAGFTLMLWVSIQPGNWLEKWQLVLREYDLKGNEFMYRIGGGCQLCFSHAIAQLSNLLYVPFMVLTIGWGLTGDGWGSTLFLSVSWYLIYVSIGTNLNLFFIIKLYSNGVNKRMHNQQPGNVGLPDKTTVRKPVASKQYADNAYS